MNIHDKIKDVYASLRFLLIILSKSLYETKVKKIDQ